MTGVKWQQRNVDGRREWLDRDARNSIWRKEGSTPCLTSIRSGQGVWLEDHEGKRYLDLYGNSVHHVGYRHPRMVEALTAQLNELTFSPRRFTNEPAVLVAECLLKHWPGGSGKVLLTTGGSDAIELAMKIARVATGRYKTISFYDSVSWQWVRGSECWRASRRPLATPRPPAGGGAPCAALLSARRRWNEQTDSPRAAQASLEAIRFVFARERDIAAVIAEPIRSTPHMPPDWYWPEVRQAMRRVWRSARSSTRSPPGWARRAEFLLRACWRPARHYGVG